MVVVVDGGWWLWVMVFVVYGGCGLWWLCLWWLLVGCGLYVLALIRSGGAVNDDLCRRSLL